MTHVDYLIKPTASILQVTKQQLPVTLRAFRNRPIEAKPVVFLGSTPLYVRRRKTVAPSFTNCVLPGFFNEQVLQFRSMVEVR